ncbi:MAG TPA: hypothetical protein VM553_11535 [Dongiaceae bacterium]|nr:hypothetical protein [Dongiaceae bacterium]
MPRPLPRSGPSRLSPGKILLMVLLCSWLAACSENPDQARLLERLDTLEIALQDKKPDAVLDLLTDNFSTGQGQTRDDVKRLLLVNFLRNQTIGVIRTGTEVAMDDSYRDQASAHFQALVTGGEGLLPERGRQFRVESRWLFQDGDWFLDRLEWKPL